MKKFGCLFLSFIFMLALIPIAEVDVCAYTYGDYYLITSGGYAEIREFTNTAFKGELVIPDTIGSYTVTGIYDYAFDDCTALESVVIPDTVKYIGASAFEGCTALESLTIGENVSYVEIYAFNDCPNLKKIEWNAKNLKYEYGDYSYSFYGYVFTGAGVSGEGIELVFGNKVESIPDYAFYATADYATNAKLKSIHFGGNIKNFGDHSFASSSSITNLTFENGITSIPSSITRGTAITHITIPDSVTSINNWAFSSCNALTSVNLPDNLTSIGDSAFQRCSALTNINIPDNVTAIGDYAFSGCSALTSVNIPDNLTAIGNYTFQGCSSLASVNIPDNVTAIGNFAFAGCSSLPSITIPDNVLSVGHDAFANCVALEKVVWNVPNAECTYASKFFENAGTSGNGIEFIFGDSVKSIPYAFFGGTTSLNSYKPTKVTSVKIGRGMTSIPDRTFQNCIYLKEVILPDTITTIGAGAFYDCRALVSITIPDSVTSIGTNAFFNCGALKEISVPFVGASRTAGGASNGVFGYLFGASDVGEYVVANQYYSVLNFVEYNIPTSLEKVYITDATQIPYGAFEGCLGIDYIELNEGITQISQLAFANCDFLSVHMPKTITRIGTDAFKWTDVEKLYVSMDSYCHDYAETNSYPYEIYDYFPVTGVTLDKTRIDINEGDTQKLSANILPDNATYPTVNWSSSNENIATVSQDGTVTAVSRGSATITATTTEGGYTANCTVNVLRPVTGVELNSSEINIGLGNSKTLTATVYPSGASDKSVTWKSSDTNVATVTNGIVTAVGYGSAIITVTTNDGGFEAQCTVNTATPVSSISLNKTSTTLYINDSLTLSATVLPADAYDKSVIWTSSDESVATVSGGNVTALSEGKATITATTADGGYKATCEITVTSLATDEPIDENSPYIKIDSAKTTPGNTITMDVSIANNPGFVSLGLQIEYDSSYLTLTGIKSESGVGATFTPAQSYSKIPYNFGFSSTDNVYYNGKIATLTFTIAESTPDGVYPVSLSYYKGVSGNYTDGYDVNYDENFESLGLSYVSGNIVIASYTPGDVNGDSNITDRDATFLLRYLAGWNLLGIVEQALDVDGSGTVNDRDATTLLRYLAGWNIELK